MRNILNNSILRHKDGKGPFAGAIVYFAPREWDFSGSKSVFKSEAVGRGLEKIESRKNIFARGANDIFRHTTGIADKINKEYKIKNTR